MSQSVFIAATGQHVGKTTICLGVLASLLKKHSTIGFIKPVGQQHVKISQDLNVDKDVVLFKEYFNLDTPYEMMSPVIIPPGFTRLHLDQKITTAPLLEKIKSSYHEIASSHPYTIVEGTGHIGVGSIVDLSNARVASELGLEMVIIASGGLGSAFDELAINLALAKQYGVRVRGIILNKVLDDKREMIMEYFPKALKRWGIPLIGCIPYDEFLSSPTMRDYEGLFKTQLLSGEAHHYRHFQHIRLVAGAVTSHINEMVSNELIITPASRLDIIQETIKKHLEFPSFEGGMILTGDHAPSKELIEQLNEADIPVIYTPMISYDVMKMITSYIAKIRLQDTPKVEEAIHLVEEHIDVELLFDKKLGLSQN